MFIANKTIKGEPVHGIMRFPKMEIGIFILVTTGLYEGCFSILANPLVERAYGALCAGVLCFLIGFNVWFFFTITRELAPVGSPWWRIDQHGKHVPSVCFIENRCVPRRREKTAPRLGGSPEGMNFSIYDCWPLSLVRSVANQTEAIYVSPVLSGKGAEPEEKNGTYHITWRQAPLHRRLGILISCQNLCIGEWIPTGLTDGEILKGYRVMDCWGAFFAGNGGMVA